MFSLVNWYALGMTDLKPISSRLPAPLIKKMKAQSKSSGLRMEALIAAAISEYLERAKQEKSA